MGSYAEKTNLLEYLRSKSQVDCDSLDIDLAKTWGKFVDSTSNQADAYLELIEPHRAEILKSSALLAQQLLSEYNGVTYEELAVEIAMCKLSLSIAPYVTGAIHVMTNPTLTSISDIVENAQRISNLCSRLQPEFEISRLCVKVVSTWEGLQACRRLSVLGISTLATTLFTMEQAILAAEAECVYIAPFVHELKAFFDETYDDGGANLVLCREAQEYYEHHSHKTRVKAAGLLTAAEAKKLAGVASLTIAPALLHTLAETQEEEVEASRDSLFANNPEKAEVENGYPKPQSFLNNEMAYREAFTKRYGGKGEAKTKQAIAIFSEYERKAETLMRENRPLGKAEGETCC